MKETMKGNQQILREKIGEEFKERKERIEIPIESIINRQKERVKGYIDRREKDVK